MARGGSKSIPKKNLIKIHGFPLIAWTIAACKLSKQIDKCILSTDDSEIAKIASQYGAYVPFIRPKKYARDNSTDYQVFKHFLNWSKKNNINCNLIVQLRPTTPFRDPKIIDKAVKLMKKKSKIQRS